MVRSATRALGEVPHFTHRSQNCRALALQLVTGSTAARSAHSFLTRTALPSDRYGSRAQGSALVGGVGWAGRPALGLRVERGVADPEQIGALAARLVPDRRAADRTAAVPAGGRRERADGRRGRAAARWQA